MILELRKTFQFESAHLLPFLPASHKCRRLHGHSFQVEIAVSGAKDPRLGWVMDYAEISDLFRPIWSRLDHFYLNDIPGLENPTSENIAIWIWNQLQPRLPALVEVVVAETCTARCVYRGDRSSSVRSRKPGSKRQTSRVRKAVRRSRSGTESA